MRISEIFYSIQGEGLLAGVPSVFVRTSGCPLRCEWCDTPYTSWAPEGEQQSIEEIVAMVDSFGARHVVVTGGEPMVAVGIDSLCAAFRHKGYHITIETAGVAFQRVECDLASVSPKLSNSTPHQKEGGRFAKQHEERRWRPEVIRAFMEAYEYQLKFVIDGASDLSELLRCLEELPNATKERVLLMPQGRTREELRARGLWVQEACKTHGFRFCPRLHVELFGDKRGV
jgi:7-carboxy-7-deazaguanine synthase